MSAEIEWLERPYGSESGSINGITIWTAGYDGISAVGGSHYLRCRLPGIKEHVKCSSLDAAKERAGRQFNVFCSKLGLAPALEER